jgi:hypothetical protein
VKLSAATAALTIALLSATIASAAGPVVSWTVKDMKAAVRALGYPKPHPTKLACRGHKGQFTSFRCVATYRHRAPRLLRAVASRWAAGCAPAETLTGCKLLRRGFVPTAAPKGGSSTTCRHVAHGR